MPRLIEKATRIQAAGNKPKSIDEVFGRVNSDDDGVSIALMHSPPGWQEPGQCPEFDEYTVVLEGAVVVEHESGTLEVRAGQAVHTRPGEWVRYGTPTGARYVAICLPAFSPATVHRDGRLKHVHGREHEPDPWPATCPGPVLALWRFRGKCRVTQPLPIRPSAARTSPSPHR